MKKLKLKAVELGASELLSREQLRIVLGGSGSSGRWQCCTPDFKLCGQCNTAGTGGCEGNGVVTPC